MRYGHVFFILCMGLWGSVSFANVVGTDIQNFNPSSSGLDFVTVQSSETLEPGLLNAGLFFNLARNTLPYFEDPPGTGYDFDDSLVMADLNIGLGLLRNLDIGANFPFLVSQTNSSTTANLEYVGNGNTEIRLNAKWRLWGDNSYGMALIGTTSFNRVTDSPFLGKGGGPVFNLETALDTTWRRVAMALNLGYRWKNPGEQIPGTPIKPFRNQVIGSVAASYLLPGLPMKIIGEVYGAQPARHFGDTSDELQTVAEWLLGAKIDATREAAIHVGGGSRLTRGSASPDWRVYTGINFAGGAIFGEKPKTQQDVVEAEEQKLPLPITPGLADRVPVTGSLTFVAPEVLFKFDKDVPEAKSVKELLEPLVVFLKKSPVYKHLTIKGHTDSIGSEKYNDELSLRRAKNVKAALIEVFQLSKDKMTAVGYGETQPIADNGNYQGRRKNRRVEFTIVR